MINYRSMDNAIINRLYEVKWRDCLAPMTLTWSNDDELSRITKNYTLLTITAYLIYQDDTWFGFSMSPRTSEQYLSPILFPKSQCIEMKEIYA